MVISFQHKTVVITGGTSGIGKVAAKHFAEAGASVVVLGRDASKISDLLSGYDTIRFYHCDLTDVTQIAAVFDQIGEAFGKIDILVNNAGIQTYGTAADTSIAVWDKTFNVNLKAAFLCTQHTLPLMKGVKGAVIINVGSVQGFVSQRNVTAYASSKEALHGFTRSVAIDYAPQIRCVGVSPGAVNTPMLEHDIQAFENREAILEETRNIHLLKRIAEPEEIAHFILFLASDKASFATGHTYRVDGGIGLLIQGT